MRKSLCTCAAVIAAFLSLSTAYASDNKAVEVEYEPTRRGSRTGVLKTAIMGLAMMSMPEPVKAQIPTYPPTPGVFYGFGDCYLGTIDPIRSTDMQNITIKTIKSAPCNLYYDYPPNEFKDISMIISTACLSQSHCEASTIKQIKMCSSTFQVDYSGELRWNYKNNNNYTQFSLYLYNSPYTPFHTYGPGYSGPNNYLFSQVFKKYMDDGSCSSTSRQLLSADNQETNDTDY